MNTRHTTEAAMTQRHSTALKNALTTVLATTTVVASTGAFAEPLPAPGALLRQGEWGGSVGTFLVPAPFEGTSATQWPMDGWVVLLLDAQAATLTIRPLAAAEARERFKPITEQVTRVMTGRDYPMIMAVVLSYGVFLAIMNLVVDLAYGALDPRIRY
jgi:hypothetical protein